MMIKSLLACVFIAISLPALHAAPAGVLDPMKTPSPEYIAALREAVRAFNARDFEGTLKAIDSAERLNPPNPLTLNTRGAALIEQRRFDEGLEYCQKALALD